MLFCLELFPCISFAVFCILLAILFLCRKYIRKNAFWTHSKLFFAGMLIVVALALIPIVYYLDIPEDTALRSYTPDGPTAFFNGAIALKDYFTFDADYSRHLEVIRRVITSETVAFVYIIWIAFLSIVAPITTVSFIVSFFGNVWQYIKFIRASNDLFRKKNLCVFSDLNEKSIVLATDLAAKNNSVEKKKKEKKEKSNNIIVFTNAKDNDLLPQAKSIGAICLSKSIMEYDIRKKNVCLYLMSEDEPQNTILAMRLKEKYKGKKSPKTGQIKMNVFATGKSSELQLSNASDGLFIVRRINAVQMLIYSLLDTKLFDTAKDIEGHKLLIHAVILGMGERGTEMVKALSWFCQKDGYVLKIDAFDKDPLAKEKFSALCPELMSSPEYDITIHSGVDTDTEEFIEEFNRLNNITFVFVSLGSDERNVKNAVCIQTLLERRSEYSLLDTKVLFDTAKDIEGHKLLIHAVILGMGERGTEMVKALSWFCQKDGYVLKIDAFDKDPLAKEKFSALCPELMSNPEYDITIHSGVDTDTEEFIEEFNRLNNITYVFVSLGSNERNVKNAVCIQTLLERRPETSRLPYIHAAVPKPYIHAAVSKEEYALATQKKTAPKNSILEQVGELEKNYSNECLFQPKFEEAARCIHELWNHSKDEVSEKIINAAIEIQKKDSSNPFYEEYNYRSSLASAIHIIAIGPCPKEEETARAILEHRRWCAYQRSEGYIVGSWSEEGKAKNEVARTHADLVPYDDLGDNKPGNDKNKKKDEQDKDLILINSIDLILSYYNEENEKLHPAKEEKNENLHPTSH